jgi:hypothetical protein
MNINKIMALIGNILFTLNNVIALIFAIVFGALLGDISRYGGYNPESGFRYGEYSYHMGEYSNDIDWQIFVNDILPWIIGFVILILVISIIMNIFTWIAFAKMEGPHGRGWRIFLLVIGILNIGSLFAGIFFILAFALKPNNTPETEPLNY